MTGFRAITCHRRTRPSSMVVSRKTISAAGYPVLMRIRRCLVYRGEVSSLAGGRMGSLARKCIGTALCLVGLGFLVVFLRVFWRVGLWEALDGAKGGVYCWVLT